MNKRKSFFLLFIIAFWLLIATIIFPKKVLAAPLIWTKSTDIDNYSQDIRVDPTDSNIVYATIRNSSGSALFKSTNKGISFDLKFPFAQNRDVNSVAISQLNSNKIWIGTYEKGVFKSINGGDTWTESGLDFIKIRSLVVDPVDDKILYAGTGDNNTNGGIYKSNNGGDTWNLVGETTYGKKNNLNLFIDKSNHNRVFAGSDFGLFVSTDAGINWQPTTLTGNTNPPATLVSGLSSTTIFSSVYPDGLYKSIDNGSSWTLKNTNVGSSFIFRAAEDLDGSLFLSRREDSGHIGGGVWRSKDRANTWENVADSSWGNKSTWGLDIGGRRIFVSVENLGTYWADTGEKQTVAVFIPGFGGSWSYKGLVENQATGYSDWQLIPLFTDGIYKPLLTALNPLIFAYDFRKSVADSAASLNNFLTDKAAGKKANIIAHSMGGLVARYCLEKIPGCAAKINKIVTAGTPHQGTLTAYDFWEAGKIDESDVLLRTMEEIALHATAWPDLLDKDIVQNRFPGVKDSLPNNYTAPATVSAVLTTQSGNSLPTHASFTATSRSIWEKTLGLWADGKPESYINSIGDGTVTKTSAEISAATIKSYGVEHKDYFKNTDSLTDILNTFGLTGTLDLSVNRPTSILAYIIHSPATIAATVGANLNGKVIFITDPVYKNYPVTVTGTGNGNYSLDSFYFTASASSRQTKTGTIQNNQVVNINWENNIDDLLNSLRKKIAASSNRQLKLVEANIIKAVKVKDINSLEKNYREIYRLVSAENLGNSRRELLAVSDDLLLLTNKLNTAVFSATTVNAEIARAQKSVDLKLAKTNLSLREAANLQLAQDNLSRAKQSLNYKGLLLARGTVPLVN